MFGGRAAEKITFRGEISTDASNDLKRASEPVRQMVTRFGMSEEGGNLKYGKPMTGRFLQSPFTARTESECQNSRAHRRGSACVDRRMLWPKSGDSLSPLSQVANIARKLVLKETSRPCSARSNSWRWSRNTFRSDNGCAIIRKVAMRAPLIKRPLQDFRM